MDVRNALTIAHSLSDQFNGDAVTALRDFRKTSDFCTKNEALNLNKSACGELAASVAKLGEHSGQSVAGAFQDAFEFSRSTEGPGLAIPDAIKQAEELIAISPKADNFIRVTGLRCQPAV